MSNTEIIILAAGRGTRLGVLGEQIPKAIIQIDKSGSTLISRLIEQFKSVGQINVVIGHRSDLIGPYLRQNYPEVRIIYNDHYSDQPNSYSMSLGLSAVSKSTNRLLVIDADTYLSANSAYQIKVAIAMSQYGAIFTTSTKRPEGEWEVIADQSNKIIGILDKPLGSDNITSGATFFTGKSLEHLIQQINGSNLKNLRYWDDIYYKDYSEMQMHSYQIPGFVYEVDNPDDIKTILERSDRDED